MKKTKDDELKEIYDRGIERFKKAAQSFTNQRKLSKIQQSIEKDDIEVHQIFWLFELLFDDDLDRLAELLDDNTEKMAGFMNKVLLEDNDIKKY